jgi:hypothetical protein
MRDLNISGRASLFGYLIDHILPTRRVSLLGGSSNVGKTRWTLPAFRDWAEGKPVLGFHSNPVPWSYVSGDRLLIEAEDSINSLGIDPKVFNIIPAYGEHNKTWIQVIEAAEKKKVQFLLWEGFTDFCPPPGQRHQVREFLSSVSACCQPSKEFPDGLTILGIVESPKLKPNERYKDPRQRISGAAAWGYHSSSVFLIERFKPEDVSNGQRVLYASLKNAPDFDTKGHFEQNGLLHFPPPGSAETL